MNRHHPYRAITNIRGRLVAALFSVTMLGMLPASNSWGETSGHNLNSVSVPYQNILSSLGTPMTFLTGAPPMRSIGIGDADGDGHTDLIVAEAGVDTWWALSGDGIGGFAAPTAMPTGARQKVVAIGDLNGDQINDQAVMEQFAASAWLLLGNGTGGFHKAGSSGKSTSGAVLVADFNSDGKHDLAVIDGKTRHVMVSLGNDEGDYGAETPVSVGAVPDVLATGDFNQDGVIDLALGSSGGKSVAILLGDQNGGFVPAREFQVDLRPTSLAIGDLNGDGMADVAVADRRANHLSVLFGDGTGGFLAPSTIIMPANFGAGADVVSDSRRKESGNDVQNLSSSDSTTGSYSNVYEGVAALTLNPATIVGGSGVSATGTITLNAPAPAGGVVVTLASSNLELAASVPSIRVPEGATTATFTIATNAHYRRYSGLAFSVTISATRAATHSATLTVTAQPRPTAPASNPRQDRSGPNCTAGEAGILFDCEADLANPLTCVFLQECTLGCLTRPSDGLNWNDACAATGPFPISLNPKRIVGGNQSTGTFLLGAPATAGSTGLASNGSLVAGPESRLNMPIPTGATSLDFKILTAPVNAIEFVNFDALLTMPEPHPDGGTFFARRHARTWSVVVPGAPLPVNLVSLNLEATSVVGGTFITATACVDQPKLAPAVGDIPLTIASSNPAVASLGVPSFPQGSNCSVVGVQTVAVAATTVVTITATLGTQILSIPLTVTATLAATQVTSFFLDPLLVIGGNSSTGTVVLNGLAPSGGAVVTLTSANTQVVVLPASVTVAGGTDRVNFVVSTNLVAADTTVSLTANYGVPTFTSLTVLPAGPALTLSSHTLNPTSVVGGSSSTGTVTLSAAAPTGGAVVSLSDNSTAATVPASVTVLAGATSANFTVTTTSVTASASAAISAVFAGVTRTAALTVNPSAPPTPAAPTLVSPAADATPAQPVTFDWSDVANATSYEIQVDDSSTIAAPFRANQIVSVSQATIGGLPAQRLWWRVRAQNSAGVFGPFSATRRFTPQAAPTAASLSAVSVNPTSVVGGNFSTGTATLSAAAPAGGAVVTLSSNAAAASVPASVTVAAGATSTTFTVTTTSVITSTSAIITGSFGGVSRTATLTVTPVPPPASLSTLALNPTSVTGGATSQGTLTLTSAAPTGGAVVSLSDNSTAATVLASVTVPAGASSANFTVTTTSVTASTSATISAVLVGVTRTAALTVNPAAAGVSLTVTASGRSGERVVSSPVGINVAVGSTQSSGFTTNSSITLSVSNGRDAIWSGACSSGGNRTATCTFTITGNASVTGNVQ